MRVALFTETYLPDVNGVAAHIKTLKDGLEQLGHDVLVVAADKHCKHHYVQDNVLHCPSVEVKRFYGFGVAPPYSRKRIKLVAQFNPDILHIHHEFGIGLSGIFAAKKMNRPLVYTLHTMYDQYIFYIAPRPLHRAATKVSQRYERFIAAQATALTGPSQKCDEYFKRIGVKKEMSIIPNSADLDAFNLNKPDAKARDALLREFNLDGNKTIACFVGRLGQEKSVDVLLHYWSEAIQPEDNLHLLIIGDGPDSDELKSLTGKLGIDSMVTFTGRVKHELMPDHFGLCDVYVTASLSEMNSISMLEGMASGLPTMQRYDELNADQIKTGVNGYLYNSSEELAGYLRNIAIMDPKQKRELKERVRASVIDRGASDLAKYMLGVYQKAIYEKKHKANV